MKYLLRVGCRRWLNRLTTPHRLPKYNAHKSRQLWSSILHAGGQGKLTHRYSSKQSFPNYIKLMVTLHPIMVTDRTVTAEVQLDEYLSQPTPIYQQLKGDALRIYGRCARIDLLLKEWIAVGEGDVSRLTLSIEPGQRVFSKPFYTVTEPIQAHQTVIDHRCIDAETRKVNIYPYGGYLAMDGVVGDALYMTVSAGDTGTNINVHHYSELCERGIHPFELSGAHSFQCEADPLRALPLLTVIETGHVTSELQTIITEDVWVQTYQSESLVRKDGTYEAVLTLRRQGSPTKRRI